jgi:SET domain-containing protein
MLKKNKNYIVKKSSAGLGLFASQDIAKEEYILEYVGPILNDAQADKKAGRYLFNIKKNKTIDGSSRKNIARYFNHSCKPNCEAINEDDKRIYIQTKRAIKKGEELTYDYGKEYVDEFCKPCLCSACSKK